VTITRVPVGGESLAQGKSKKAPEKWDEDEDYEDAVQDDDCHDTEDGSDVIDEPSKMFCYRLIPFH
jgi:hypothetical protein